MSFRQGHTISCAPRPRSRELHGRDGRLSQRERCSVQGAMFRHALCIAVLVGCGSSSSPSPATPTKPVVIGSSEPAKPPPEKPIEAQALFTLWLDAFNGSDEARLAAFAEHLASELAKNFPGARDLLGFREQTGGFDVKKTEDATPKKYVAIVKERDDDQYARVVLELDASNRVSVFDIRIVPTPAEYKPERLSEADAIAALRTELDALV